MTTTIVSEALATGSTPAPRTDNLKISRLRAWLCAGTIAATLPYIALKVAWMAGARIGVRGDGMDSATMVGANAMTLGMDAIAALIALALVRPWGCRLPAALLLFPMWVATGFLAPVLVGAPLSAVVGSLSGDGTHTNDGQGTEQIAGWVFTMVYTGFGLQCIGLLAGFLLYARSRWAGVFTLRMRELPAGAGFAPQRMIVSGVAAFSVLPAGVHLYWAAGGSALRPGDDRSWPVRLVMDGMFGLLPLVGTVGMLLLAWRRDDRPARGALAAAWLGTATMFSWGFWWMLAAAVTTPVSAGDMKGLGLVGALGMLGGAVLATVLGVMVGGMAERWGGGGMAERWGGVGMSERWGGVGGDARGDVMSANVDGKAPAMIVEG